MNIENLLITTAVGITLLFFTYTLVIPMYKYIKSLV